jgi:hypothetical protein
VAGPCPDPPPPPLRPGQTDLGWSALHWQPWCWRRCSWRLLSLSLSRRCSWRSRPPCRPPAGTATADDADGSGTPESGRSGRWTEARPATVGPLHPPRAFRNILHAHTLRAFRSMGLLGDTGRELPPRSNPAHRLGLGICSRPSGSPTPAVCPASADQRRRPWPPSARGTRRQAGLPARAGGGGHTRTATRPGPGPSGAGPACGPRQTGRTPHRNGRCRLTRAQLFPAAAASLQPASRRRRLNLSRTRRAGARESESEAALVRRARTELRRCPVHAWMHPRTDGSGVALSEPSLRPGRVLEFEKRPSGGAPPSPPPRGATRRILGRDSDVTRRA